MWKIFFGVALTAALIATFFLIDSKNHDSDEDVMVYTVDAKSTNNSLADNSVGNGNFTVYVVKNTLVNRTQDKANRRFSVDVKILSGMASLRNNYSFRENDGLIYYSVDGGAEEQVKSDTMPDKIWKYGLKHLGID